MATATMLPRTMSAVATVFPEEGVAELVGCGVADSAEREKLKARAEGRKVKAMAEGLEVLSGERDVGT